MSLDPIEFVDETVELADLVKTGGELPGEIQIELDDLSERINEAIKQSNVEIKNIISGNVVETSFIGNGKTEPIRVKTSFGDLEFSEAITDERVNPESIGESVRASSEATGLNLPEQNVQDIIDRVSNNPTRAINEAVNRVEPEKTKLEADKSLITNDPDFQAREALIDNPNTDPQTRNEAAAKNRAAWESSSEKTDLDEKAQTIREKVSEKTWMDYLEKAGAWTVKGLALLIAGTITYDLLKAYQNELKGCWQAVSTGKSVSKVKIQSLTCDSCCNATGDYQPKPDTHCDPKNPPAGAPCTCQPSGCISGPGVDCECGNSCQGEPNPGLCSMWCSNAARTLTGEGNTTYSYACNNPSLTDTIADIATNVDDIISNLIGGAAQFIQTLLKWGAYLLLAVGVVLLLYFGVKSISGILKSPDNKPTNPS